MQDCSDSPIGETASFVLRNNLYWNGDAAIPTDGEDQVNYTDNPQAVVGNPLLGSQQGLQLPRWDSNAGSFADGSSSIRQAFERLVQRYGTPADGSAALDTADLAQTPGDDILGASRAGGGTPDLGAYERQTVGLDQRCYLPSVRKP